MTKSTGLSTGHSRSMRLTLKAAREERGWSAREVGEKIAEHLSEMEDEKVDAVSMNTVYAWEKFERHPSIAMYAAWARVLGFKLVVMLDGSDSGRTAVMVRSAEAAEIARRVDALPADKRKAIADLVRVMAKT